jgi:hypothetical protein
VGYPGAERGKRGRERARVCVRQRSSNARVAARAEGVRPAVLAERASGRAREGVPPAGSPNAVATIEAARAAGGEHARASCRGRASARTGA